MVWRVRRRHCVCLASFVLMFFVSRIEQVRQHALQQQADLQPDTALALPLKRLPARSPLACLEPLTAPQAACRLDVPLWPAVRQAVVPCSAARSTDRSTAAARLCSSLLESLDLDASTRAAVAPQLQLLRTSLSDTLKRTASPVTKDQCQLRVHLASSDPTTEPWLPRLSVAEQSIREAYNLSIVAAAPGGVAHVNIHSNTVLGLRHALRTLATLVSSASPSVASSDDRGIVLPVIDIHDRPRFGYRGLILDTAHHFLSVDGLLGTIVLLGRLKYNVLHWHLTDTQSFQLVVPSHPELAQASSKPSERYSLEDLRTVVAAARLEGVSVLLEIETPGHASSWAHSHPELALVGPTESVAAHVSPSGESYTKCPAGKGNLDPTSENLYKVLGKVLEDLDEDVLPLAAVHMGGEEVHWGCWSTDSIERWAADHEQLPMGHDKSARSKRMVRFESDAAHKAYAFFQERLHNALLPSLPSMRWRRPIVWEDVLFEAPSWARSRLYPSNTGRRTGGRATEASSNSTESQTAGDRVIVEVFKRPKGRRMSLFNATALGYDALFTNVDALYLDFGHDWTRRYKYEPFKEDLRPGHVEIVEGSAQAERVLGGEGGCWGKCMAGLVERAGLWGSDSAQLTGLMAMAERLWSDAAVVDVECARVRMNANEQMLHGL